MNIEHPYWYFDSVISPEKCNEIINLGLSKAKIAAEVNTGSKDKSKITMLNKNIRSSKVAWVNDKWIFKLIHPYIHAANKNAGWNFQWEFSEPCQFTEYSIGQYYGWHCDSPMKPYNWPANPRHGKIRKLSMTLTLSDKDEYEGGDLEFDYKSTKGKAMPIIDAMRNKGSLIVFPSFVWHRVTEVKIGKRHSLVCWNLGNPYR